jgi:hypothetical protein
MEVILTLSNRITFAGAIPLLVAVALAVLVAAIALAPSSPASAAPTAANCELSPLFRDMLLERYSLKAYQCNELDISGAPADIIARTGYAYADGETATTWDFSGQDLDSFAISDDDAKILRELTDSDSDLTNDPAGTVVEQGVLYIDLTDNPLTVADVNFKNIPNNVAVILSAESNVSGFQATDYEVTENGASYISVAFPNLIPDASSTVAFTVTLGDDATSSVSAALGIAATNRTGLIQFGTTDAGPSKANVESANDPSRTFVADSEAEDKIFYWPITVGKDNSNDDDWDISLKITETSPREATVIPEFDLTNDEADVTVLDADAPAVSVCDRSEHVEDAILAFAGNADGTTPLPTPQTGTYPNWDGNNRCGDITSRDLGTIAVLDILDTDDREPITDLIAGDFESLSGLTSLTITGARSLPSGIFAGVGSAGSDLVTIRFAQNTSTDDDIDNVGNFKPSTIPSHIWDDQEEDQVIILADDLDDDDMGVTSGLDAALYAGEENGHFFVLTSTTTAKYVLGNSVVFGTGDGATTFLGGAPGLVPHATADDKPMVVRFAVDVPNVDDKDKGDRTMWLFLFKTDNDATVGDPDTDPSDASDLAALATVAITDDD